MQQYKDKYYVKMENYEIISLGDMFKTYEIISLGDMFKTYGFKTLYEVKNPLFCGITVEAGIRKFKGANKNDEIEFYKPVTGFCETILTEDILKSL